MHTRSYNRTVWTLVPLLVSSVSLRVCCAGVLGSGVIVNARAALVVDADASSVQVGGDERYDQDDQGRKSGGGKAHDGGGMSEGRWNECVDVDGGGVTYAGVGGGRLGDLMIARGLMVVSYIRREEEQGGHPFDTIIIAVGTWDGMLRCH